MTLLIECLAIMVLCMLQSEAEKIEELLKRETMLKNEIQQLNEQISELRRQHTDELEQLSEKNLAEIQRLTEELAREKESSEAGSLERGTEFELVYYQRHLEAVQQIDELRDTVAEQQTEIDNLQENVRCRDAEIEQLKATVSSMDTSDGGLVAAIQLDLERVSSER